MWVSVLLCCLLLTVAVSTVEAVGMGIGIRPIYADDKNRLELPDTAGCIVVSVQKGGAGDLVGLKSGDVIRTFNGEPVANMPAFLKQAPQAPTLQSIGIWRDGKAQTLSGQGPAGAAGTGGIGMAAPERAQPLDGFLGLAWNTPLAAARQQLQARGGLTNGSSLGAEKEIYALLYKGTFAGRSSEVVFSFANGQFYRGMAYLRSPVDDVLKNYDAMSAEITEKYGLPNRRAGRYLDQRTTWLFPAGQDAPNSIVLDIQRISNASASAFIIRIEYIYGVIQKNLDDKKSTNTKKDL
jgi:hypothetical protein